MMLIGDGRWSDFGAVTNMARLARSSGAVTLALAFEPEFAATAAVRQEVRCNLRLVGEAADLTLLLPASWPPQAGIQPQARDAGVPAGHDQQLACIQALAGMLTIRTAHSFTSGEYLLLVHMTSSS
jgi:hypothetical protein